MPDGLPPKLMNILPEPEETRAVMSLTLVNILALPDIDEGKLRLLVLLAEKWGVSAEGSYAELVTRLAQHCINRLI